MLNDSYPWLPCLAALLALWKDGLWQLYAPVATGPGAELVASKVSTLD